MVLLASRFPRLISLPTSTIFVSGTSGITSILKYRGINPIPPLVVRLQIWCSEEDRITPSLQFLPAPHCGTIRVPFMSWIDLFENDKYSIGFDLVGFDGISTIVGYLKPNIKQVLATTPHETPTLRTLAPHHKKLYKFDEPDTRDTAGEARTSS